MHVRVYLFCHTAVFHFGLTKAEYDILSAKVRDYCCCLGLYGKEGYDRMIIFTEGTEDWDEILRILQASKHSFWFKFTPRDLVRLSQEPLTGEEDECT